MKNNLGNDGRWTSGITLSVTCCLTRTCYLPVLLATVKSTRQSYRPTFYSGRCSCLLLEFDAFLICAPARRTILLGRKITSRRTNHPLHIPETNAGGHRSPFNYGQRGMTTRSLRTPSVAGHGKSRRFLGTVLGYGARYGAIRRAARGRVAAECRAWHERQHAISETPVSAGEPTDSAINVSRCRMN